MEMRSPCFFPSARTVPFPARLSSARHRVREDRLVKVRRSSSEKGGSFLVYALPCMRPGIYGPDVLRHLRKKAGAVMNRMKIRRLPSVRAAWQQLHLVDRCLLILMAILLAQSTYTLFFPGGEGQLSGSIDIVIRTSAASIFGYFLSANFAARDQQEPNAPSSSQEVPAALLEPTPGSDAASQKPDRLRLRSHFHANRGYPDTRKQLLRRTVPMLRVSGAGSRLYGSILPGRADPHTEHGIERHRTGRVQLTDRHRFPVPGFYLRLRGISHRLSRFPAEQLIPPKKEEPENRLLFEIEDHASSFPTVTSILSS